MKATIKLAVFISLAFVSTLYALEANDSSTYDEQKTNITVTAAHPQFVIKLQSNPTTGYSWFLRKYDSRFIEPVEHHFKVSDNPKLIGAPGSEYWTFKVKAEAFKVPVQTGLGFVYARPWEKANAASELKFWVSTGK